MKEKGKESDDCDAAIEEQLLQKQYPETEIALTQPLSLSKSMQKAEQVAEKKIQVPQPLT